MCDVTSDCDSILYVVTNFVVLVSQRQFSTQVDNKVIQYNTKSYCDCWNRRLRRESIMPSEGLHSSRFMVYISLHILSH